MKQYFLCFDDQCFDKKGDRFGKQHFHFESATITDSKERYTCGVFGQASSTPEGASFKYHYHEGENKRIEKTIEIKEGEAVRFDASIYDFLAHKIQEHHIEVRLLDIEDQKGFAMFQASQRDDLTDFYRLKGDTKVLEEMEIEREAHMMGPINVDFGSSADPDLMKEAIEKELERRKEIIRKKRRQEKEKKD